MWYIKGNPPNPYRESAEVIWERVTEEQREAERKYWRSPYPGQALPQPEALIRTTGPTEDEIIRKWYEQITTHPTLRGSDTPESMWNRMPEAGRNSVREHLMKEHFIKLDPPRNNSTAEQ